MCANFFILMNYALNFYLVIFGLQMLIHQNPRFVDSTHRAWAQIIFSGPQKIIDLVLSPTLDTLYDYLPFWFFFSININLGSADMVHPLEAWAYISQQTC